MPISEAERLIGSPPALLETQRGTEGIFFMTFPERGKVIKPLALRALVTVD